MAGRTAEGSIHGYKFDDVDGDGVYEPGGGATEIINAGGDGTNAIDVPRAMATDDAGKVYVAVTFTDNVFHPFEGDGFCVVHEPVDHGGGNDGIFGDCILQYRPLMSSIVIA